MKHDYFWQARICLFITLLSLSVLASAQTASECLCEFGIQYMTVRYDGPSAVDVKVYATKNQQDLVQAFTDVSTGDQLFVDKSAFLHGSVKTKTYFQVVGDAESAVSFHTSCSEDILNQTKGFFTVTAYQDAFGNSCSVAMDLQASVTDIDCYGENSGAIDLSVSGGFPPYGFVWNDGDTTQNRSGLDAGSYSVHVSDALGNAVDSTFVIESPEELSIDAETSQVACGNSPGGTVTLSVQGGTTPYAYLWSTGDTTNQVTGLDSGQYTVAVTDANGCELSDTIIIDNAVALTVNIAEDSCQSGTLTAGVSGGEAPYTFGWSTGVAGNQLTVNESGTYYVAVTDANGCEANDTLQLTEIAFIEATPTYTEPTCHDGDGDIEVTVTGNHGPYSYVWNTGDTTKDLTNVPAGDYELTVTDQRGSACKETFSFKLNTPEPPSAIATVNQISCAGSEDASISIDSLVGTSPFELVWSTGDTIYTISDLESGSYSVSITDSLGCSASATFLIDEPDTLSLALGYDFCIDADIKATVSGGTGPYSFTWNGTPGGDSFTPDSAGLYQVLVTDANGCQDSASIEVPEPFEPLNISGAITQLTCSDSLSGAIDLTITGGQEPYEYLWSNGATTSSLDSLGSGYYEVTVSDQKGCEKSRLFYIRPQETLAISAAVTEVSCDGGDGSISVSASGGQSPYTYEWNTGDTGATLADLSEGDYQVDVYDAGDCHTSEHFSLTKPDTCDVSGDSTSLTGCCDGKVTWLTLQYLGTQPVNVQVFQKIDRVMVFEGSVERGDDFTFYGEDRNGTLGPEVMVTVDGAPATQIHTSCSEPIGPGLISGHFKVTAGESRNGGPLCPVDEDAQQSDGRISYEVFPNPSHSGKLKLKLQGNQPVNNIQLSIYDFTGRLRHSLWIGQEWINAIIDLGELTTGLTPDQYILKIKEGSAHTTKRVIIK